MTSAPLPYSAAFQTIAPPPAASPLSPAHLAELQQAQLRAKKIRRAIRIASTDAWICAAFAGLTLLSGVFSLAALLLGLALAACAHTAFRGMRQLKVYDLTAPRLL